MSMNGISFEDKIDATFAQLNLICVVLAFGAVFYCFLSWMLIAVMDFAFHEGFSSNALWPMLVGGAGVAIIIFASRVGKNIFSESLADASEPQNVLSSYFSSKILTFCAYEIAALMGLIATIFTGELIWSIALSFAALGTMIKHWPRQSSVREKCYQN